MNWVESHRIALLGSAGVLLLSFLIYFSYLPILNHRIKDRAERFRRRNALKTIVFVSAALAILLFWVRLIQNKGTFLAILGAGLAVALREPLLSIAGRIAILAGHMFGVGDRIQINKLSGDVIDVGFFYTRMMEIGNWIQADQVTGRILQMPNSMVFGTPIFNYTQNFSYIWDEIKLPITYDSNLEAATQILKQVGDDYTKEFLDGAQQELEKMRQYFLVPPMDVHPNVFLRVTDNWLELSMRYVTDPKQRRVATNFIFTQVWKKIRERRDIQIASSTMDLTLHRGDDAAQRTRDAA
jgi:small-conductance mechanosensitive channel